MWQETASWDQKVLSLSTARVTQAELSCLQALAQGRGSPSWVFLFLSCLLRGLFRVGLWTHNSSNPRSCLSQPKPVSEGILQCGARAIGAGGCCFQCLGRWCLPLQHTHGSGTAAPAPVEFGRRQQDHTTNTQWTRGWHCGAGVSWKHQQFCYQNCSVSPYLPGFLIQREGCTELSLSALFRVSPRPCSCLRRAPSWGVTSPFWVSSCSPRVSEISAPL